MKIGMNKKKKIHFKNILKKNIKTTNKKKISTPKNTTKKIITKISLKKKPSKINSLKKKPILKTLSKTNTTFKKTNLFVNNLTEKESKTKKTLIKKTNKKIINFIITML